MVYLEPASFGWRPLLTSWLVALPEPLQEHRELVLGLVDWLVEPCLKFVFRKLKELVVTSESNLTRSLMYLFEMLMMESIQDEGKASAIKDSKLMKTWIVVGAHTYTHTYIHAGVHTYTHTYMWVCIHTHIHTYMWLCKHTRIHTHTYIHVAVHTYTHTYIHVAVQTYTHTYIHTHIHTCGCAYIHTYYTFLFAMTWSIYIYIYIYI